MERGCLKLNEQLWLKCFSSSGGSPIEWTGKDREALERVGALFSGEVDIRVRRQSDIRVRVGPTRVRKYLSWRMARTALCIAALCS